MINLLAILLSLAMMLTGAGDTVEAAGPEALLADPAARVLTLSNLTISVNDNEIKLNPSASIGVMTDGVQSVYDFHVDSNGERLLPFQVVSSADGLMLVSESSGTTVKLTAEEIDQMVNQQLNGAIEESLGSAGEEDRNVLAFLTDEFLPAYGEVLKLACDPAAMKAIQETGNAVYDENVERGDGTPEQIDYDGITYDVMTYSYILNSDQIGKLLDALYASNEVLDNYVKAYFKLLGMMAEDAPELAGMDSFEKLMGLVEMRMNVTESLSREDGLDITDILLQVSVPQVDDPFEMTIRNEKLGENATSTASGVFEVEGGSFEITVDSTVEGEAMRGSMTMSGNGLKETVGAVDGPDEVYTADGGDYDAEAPLEAEEVEEAVEEAVEAAADEAEEVAETLGELVEGDVEVIDKAQLVSDAEGETDEADDFYASMDFYYEPSDADSAYGMSWSVDVAEVASVSFSLEGLLHDDGTRENQVNIYAYGEDDTYEISFNADVNNVPFAVNADAENAVSIDAVDTDALATGVMGDVMKLAAEPSVRQLTALFEATGPQVEDDKETSGEDADDVDDSGEDEYGEGRAAEPYDDGTLVYGEPQFGWLPEGYEVSDMDMDTQYDMVDCVLSNAASGDAIYVYFTTSNAGSGLTSYAIGEDGSLEVIASPVVTEEIDGDSRRYSLDNGKVAITLYPYADGVDAAAIGQIIAGITYADQAA